MDEKVISIEIHVPRQKVWDEITKTGRIQRAVYNSVMETNLVPGAKLRYYSPNHKRVFIVGEVVEVEPPTRFAHTYRMTQWPDDEPTLVTWELAEIASGCRVTITHSGWTDAHKTKDRVTTGWTEILGILKAELETGKIPFKWKVIYALMGAFLFALPKTTKKEEVDRLGW